MALPTVGVLLPLRLETRFYGSRLRLRIVPDDPWLDRHDRLAQAGELDALERFVAAAGNDLRSAQARQAWRSFAGQVGGGRALWLFTSFAHSDGDGDVSVERPATLREAPRMPKVPYFPRTLQVWLARGGDPPAPALTLPVKVERLRVDFPEPIDPEHPEDPKYRRWWESWEEAVEVGLAGEIDLGADPTNIDVLYVVGLSDGELEAAELFGAHEAAGRLGLLAPGRPTNSVDAEPAADLGTDPDPWLEHLLAHPPPSAHTADVSRALTGVAGKLAFPLDDDRQHRGWSEAIVSGLWPALWGFAQTSLWGLPRAAETAEWAARALCPEGPYPTLRIGAQPFGLLPVTALGRWKPAQGDPPVESGMLAALQRLRDVWAAAAEQRGTIEGVDTDGLLERLAQVPTAPGYRHRDASSLELWLIGLLFLGYFMPWRAVDRVWHAENPLASALGLVPRRRYAAVGGSATLRLPLVTPEALGPGNSPGEMLRKLSDAALATPALLGQPEQLERDVLKAAPDSVLLRLAIRALQLAIGDVGRSKLGDRRRLDPITRYVAELTPLEQWIASVTPGDVTAGTPEAAALARAIRDLQKLAELADADEPRLEWLLRSTLDCAIFRIDAWIGGPAVRRLRDLPATEDGRQWRLGAYGWVDRPRPGAPGPTAAGMLHAPSQTQATAAMVLRDRAVHDAEPQRWHMDLTSRSVRAADRLAASVRAGAHLSEVLGREVERIVADPSTVRRLRESFPVRTEHAGRRVCDGQAVLAAEPSTLSLPSHVLAAFAELRAAVDAYGDLLIAEAVHDVVEGRAETAGAVMDAAAGLGRPPELSVLRTRLEGRSVSTACAIVIPAAAPPALPSDPDSLIAVSPATLAEPAFAAYLSAQLGAAAEWDWTVTGGATVTLATLGLDPADVLGLSLDDLQRLVAHAGGGAVVGGSGAKRHVLAVRLASLLGQTPAARAALAESSEPDPAPDGDDPLRQRYEDLKTVAQALLTRLRSSSASERDGGLDAARRWGIVPEAPAGAVAGPAERAAELLDARLRAAPSGELPGDALVRAVVDLVSPTGQLAILGRLTRDALPGSLAPAPKLDAEWLTVVAAVRESLARLEAHQLAAGVAGPQTPFAAWSNRPDDPWQTTAPAGRLIAVYAPAAFDLAAGPTEQLAVALVDRFSETIPSQEHSTSVAFGFDAPASRAPQAILLAVPPDLDTPLDAAGVLEIVAETRSLAHARMARPADLAAVSALLPTALLPAHGTLQVPLDEPTP